MKQEILINREDCVICDSKLSLYKTIKKFPIYMGVTDSINKDMFEDQIWGTCDNCGCLQLMKLIPYEILYKTNHHYETVGDLWKLHHLEFAKFISKNHVDSICEIGAGNDYLADIILENKKIPYSVIEPDPNISNNSVTIYRGFLDEHIDRLKNYDNIIYSHVIEHIFDPYVFLKTIYDNTKEDVSMYISIPNIEEFLKSNGSNGLNFEHTFYIDMNQFKYLLNKTGFICIEEKQFQNHSYFLKVVKGKENIKLNNIYHKAKLLDDMHLHISNFVSDVNKKIKDYSNDIYIFGAHIFTQLLIYNNLDTNKIIGILDSSIYKQRKRLYGTNLNVYDPSVIKDKNGIAIILKSGPYQEQIKNKIYNINKNIIILE